MPLRVFRQKKNNLCFLMFLFVKLIVMGHYEPLNFMSTTGYCIFVVIVVFVVVVDFLQAIDSSTGPGVKLRDALWTTGNTLNQTQLLWHDPTPEWQHNVAYYWKLIHNPDSGRIRVRWYEVRHTNKLYVITSAPYPRISPCLLFAHAWTLMNSFFFIGF